MKRAFKWILILCGIGLVLLGAAILTFPYWFGFALGTAGQRFGVSFAKYERGPNGRFVLNEVVRTNRWFDLRVSRVEGFMPYTWYRSLKATNRADAFLQVDGWRVVVHRPGSESAPVRTNQPSVYQGWKVAERYLGEVRHWMPKATLLNGTVEYNGREYTFPVVTWDDGKLDAGGVWSVSAIPFEVKGKLTGELPYQLSFNMPSLDTRARVQLMETNQALNVRLNAFYKESRADVDADFGRQGVLPETASLKSKNFTIPGNLVKLDKYNELRATITGQWRTNSYQLDLSAHADPIAAANLPPADIHLSARGDTNSVLIEQARSTAPGLEVALSDPIKMTYGGQLLSERSELRIAADLQKLPWLNSKGQIEGTLLLKKGEKFPVASFRAAGSKVEAFNVNASNLRFSGVLDWPKLSGVRFEAELGSNAVLTAAGDFDLRARSFGPSSISLEGVLGTKILPQQIHCDTVKFRGEWSGALSNIIHQGRFEFRNFSTPATEAMNVEGSWNARQITFEHLILRARAGPAVLLLSGRGYTEGTRTNLVLQQVSLSKGDDTYLQLAQEAVLTLSSGKIEMTPLKLAGPDRELMLRGAVVWPKEGTIDLAGRNVSPVLFQSFLKHSLREFELRELAISTHWSNGPVTGKMSGSFSVAEEHVQRLGTDVNLELDEGGLGLTSMKIWDASGEIGTAQGFLPVTLSVSESPRLRLAKRDRLDFELKMSTNQAFWSTIATLAKVRLTNAAADVRVHGSVAKPTGEFHFQTEALQLVRTNRELPTIGPLDAHFALNEQSLRIRDFSLRVFDQPVTVTGRLALGSNFWSQRREEIINYTLDNADLQIQAPRVDLAPFTAYLPKYLTPQGELLANIAVTPGRNLNGHIEIQRVETRPLPNVGVVQSIRAALDLHGNAVTIRDLSGVLGGERLTVTGNVDLSPERVARGYPDIDLAITGRNLPLARNPDVILRSDLDLRVRNGTNQVPVISGNATLRDSFLLRDISTLVPGRLARPERRPPYFSIQQDPISQWKLDVQVRGENFMRVRSPFFQGLVSANFQVLGTALEPMALGEASITSGQIIFPFATLDVRQALVSLTTEDPYLPHIFTVANGRAFGFDIRMEAEGPANEPVIQFTSVPVLSSEQIVLMLTTGQIPREDFSFSNTDRVSKLAFFLGKSLLTKLRPGKPEEEKLTIRSGQDITEQGRQTYEVEYKLSPRWSLVGEYDRFGALNANVKWRIVSR